MLAVAVSLPFFLDAHVLLWDREVEWVGWLPRDLDVRGRKPLNEASCHSCFLLLLIWPCGGLGGEKGWGWGIAHPHFPALIWFLLCFGLSFSLRQGLTD